MQIKILLMLVYIASISTANLSIAHFGVWVSPINSFLLIGLDLSLRDYLNAEINRLQMLLLIVAAGVISYFLNPAAAIIAVASSISFMLASFIDWLVFTKSKGEWFERANKSNAAGALVDSVVFPTIAFGSLMPAVIALQFAAKFSGAFVWAFIINKVRL